MTKKRFTVLMVFVLVMAFVAMPVFASFPDPGTGSTYTELANKTTETATAQITYYDTNGGVHQGPQRSIPGNGSISIDPDSVQLPQNFVGAGVVSSNQPLASVVATKWTGGPGDGYQMAYYSGVSAGSSRICFPSLFKNDPAIVASFAVQNTGTAPADIKITYVKRDGTKEGMYTDTIPAGAQHTYDLRTPSAQVPNFPNGWGGSAIVEVTNGQTVAGVGVINQVGRSATYNAPDCAGASGPTKLVVPSHYRHVANDHWSLLSALNVQNLEDTDAHVELKYIPRDASANSKIVNITIPPAASAALNMRSGYNGDRTFFDDLGGNWGGSVVITSDKAVVANVNTQWFRGTGPEAGYYAAANTKQGGNKFYVPYIRRVVNGTTWKEYSAVVVQNLTDANANVTIRFYDRNGTEKLTLTDTLIPGGAVGYNTRNGGSHDAADFLPLGDNFEGHALVTSNQAIAVVLNGVSWAPNAASATTNGVPAQ